MNVYTETTARARRTGWRRRRAWIVVLAWLLGPVALIAAAFQLQPTYIVLDIPVPKHTGGGEFWLERQAAQYAHRDDTGVHFFYRQAGRGDGTSQGWHTLGEAVAHFDAWLTHNGWAPSSRGVDAGALPESRLLGEENLRVYARKDNAQLRAYLAVWPAGPPADSFRVVIVTSRPSWRYRIVQNLD